MKNFVRFSRLAAITIAAVALACPAAAQADENDGLTIQQQIDQPEISNKASAPLIRHFERMGNTFGKHGLKISYERRGQILCVTVPASELFAPNDTKLSKRASKYLMAFRELVKLPQMYRILVVVHSDGTGSPEYSDALTADRADSIIDFFERITSDDGLNLVPYGVGNDEPLLPDTSIGSRAANRRVDFYIIPQPALIDQARSGHL